MSSVNPVFNMSFGSHATSRFPPIRVKNLKTPATEAKLGMLISSGEIPTLRFPPQRVKSDEELIKYIQKDGYDPKEAKLGFTVSSGGNPTLKTRGRSASLLSNSAKKIPTLPVSNREKNRHGCPAPHREKQS